MTYQTAVLHNGVHYHYTAYVDIRTFGKIHHVTQPKLDYEFTMVGRRAFEQPIVTLGTTHCRY